MISLAGFFEQTLPCSMNELDLKRTALLVNQQLSLQKHKTEMGPAALFADPLAIFRTSL
jgi:hypothetical protein